MLINKARDYICEDTTNIDMVIHNLKIEKKQIEIDKTNRETHNNPILSGMVGSVTTFLLTLISNLVTENTKGIIDNFFTGYSNCIGLCNNVYSYGEYFKNHKRS